jgi:hypothetical protein
MEYPEAGYHPCWSGLQVQGTADSPAVRKYYDILTVCKVYRSRQLLSNTFRSFFFFHPDP